MAYKHIMILATSAASLATAPAFAQTEREAIWTGPYVGGSIGYGWQPKNGGDSNETILFDTNGDGTFGDPVTTAAGANAFSPGFCDGIALGNNAGAGCRGDRDDGTAWSLHAGYDMQFGSIVVGAVVEGGQTNVSNSVTGFSSTPASYVMTRKLDWDAAARLRAGFAMGSTLIYGTGGLAYGKFKNSFTTTNSFNTFTQTDRTEDDWGWTAGGGVEQKVGQNFSVGVLYKYTRFSPNDYRVNAGQGTPPSTTNPFVITPAGSTDFARSNSRFDTHSVRATASFRF